ncbi:LysR substrate-binding domain-containing protein [Bradyrhizobium japonicum]
MICARSSPGIVWSGTANAPDVGAQVERHLSRLGIRPPRAFEFDTSDSLVAMVATGMGVAITTPLCLLQGLAHAAQVSALPLPGPGFFVSCFW